MGRIPASGPAVIGEFLERIAAFPIALSIEVLGPERNAFKAWVGLPDGRRIVEHAMLTPRGGRIVRQVDVVA